MTEGFFRGFNSLLTESRKNYSAPTYKGSEFMKSLRTYLLRNWLKIKLALSPVLGQDYLLISSENLL